jgi:hypothetical protein
MVWVDSFVRFEGTINKVESDIVNGIHFRASVVGNNG